VLIGLVAAIGFVVVVGLRYASAILAPIPFSSALIGIALEPRQFAAFWWLIVVAFLAALLGRAIAIALLHPLLRGWWAVPRPFRLALPWGGLRGAVLLALALNLPRTLVDGQPFLRRALLQALAFGIVEMWLVGGRLTRGPLLRCLRLVGANPAASEETTPRARLARPRNSSQFLQTTLVAFL
jgi:NhaP-type Na+/H+ or K+/H+ antiporter